MSEVKIGEALALIRVQEDIACLAIGHTLALSMVCLQEKFSGTLFWCWEAQRQGAEIAC